MSRGAFIKTCVLLAVTTHAHAQYLDFFNSFLQPITTSKPRHAATKRPDTKHRQTSKQKIQDIIYFESDEIIKQKDDTGPIDPFNFYTTAKPKSKARTTSHTTIKPKNVNSNKIINNNINSQEAARSVNNNNNVESRVINNGRRIENNYDVFNNVYDTTKASKQTTDYRPTFGRQTTRRPNYNKQTTKNPLLNRPGVKPAVVDHNRPPITNRPVTESPYDTPVYNKAADRPVVSYDATYIPDPRPPVNTRPPFETERPMDPGVVPPVNVGISNENTEVNIEIGPDEDDMSAAEKRRLFDVCEKKCDEYKSMRVRKIVALPLAAQRPRAAEVNVSTCAPDNVPLIIGGQLAKIETFPHMALLGWKFIQSEGYAWKCGGSLISEDYVLTAGHCTYHDKDYNVVSGPPGAVQLGSSIYNDRTATVVRVSLVVRHPKYKLRRSYYDVALLKLAVTVSFSETISPACLGVPPAVGEPVVATGWGRTEFGGDSSIQLRSVSIPIWDMNDCRDIWGTSLKLPNGPMPDNQVCAGEKKGAKDTCQGDSGGPAQVKDGCWWRVVAVTSVGRSCGAPETPALYALVPRAFVAKQVFTNSKPGRDGNNQYGNTGVNGNNNNGFGNNNNGFGTNNNGFGTNNNGFGTNNNGFGNNNNNGFGTNNNGFGNNNNGFGTNNNGFGANNNGFGASNNGVASNNNGFGANNNGFASNDNGFGNNNWNTGTNNANGNRFGGNERGGASLNANSGAVNTRPSQDTRRTSNNNNQYYSDSEGSGTNEQGTVSNNYNGNNNYDPTRNNDRAANPNNNYNNNQDNRNVNDYNNGQTTNNYYQSYGQAEQSQRGRTAEIRSDTTNYGYNNGNNAYGTYTDNSWWTK